MRTFMLLIISLLLATAAFVYIQRSTTPPKTHLMFLLGQDLEQSFVADAPYARNIADALDALSTTTISPVLSIGIGRSESLFLKTKGAVGTPDEVAATTAIIGEAASRNLPLWYHVRIRTIAFPTSPERVSYFNPTMDDFEKNPEMKQTFVDEFIKRITPYTNIYTGSDTAHACSILLFDDETPYATADVGGRFWLGSAFDADTPEPDMDGYQSEPASKRSQAADQLFFTRFSGLYQELYDIIKTKNPTCHIGFYMNAAAAERTYDDTTVIAHIIDAIPEEKQPEMVVFRLFSKSYYTQDRYESTLARITKMFKDALSPQTNLVLIGQLHTTNRQGAGAGRLPSLSQLERTVSFAKKLHLDGFGYLGADNHESSPLSLEDINGTEQWACIMHHHKSGIFMRNTACSEEEDSDPYKPNTRGWRLLIDPKDEQFGIERWQKGVELLQTF